MKGGHVATLVLVLSVLAAHPSISEGESSITKLVNYYVPPQPRDGALYK